MITPKQFSVRKRLSGIANATRGILYIVKTQHNSWIHGVATLVVIAMGIGFKLSNWEWCCLILCFLAVWSAEAFNTALELVCDFVSPEFHPLIGRTKDVAAGAVLIAAVGSVVVGVLVMWPHVRALI